MRGGLGRRACAVAAGLAIAAALMSSASAADEPDLIFRRSTVFKLLTPNDKSATTASTIPKSKASPVISPCRSAAGSRAGLAGPRGVGHFAGLPSDRPIRFKQKFAQGEDMFLRRRSLIFKKMIVRGCDTKRNVLVYMVDSDRSIQGSPRTRPPRCRSCRGARTIRFSAVPISSRNEVNWLGNCLTDRGI